MHRFPQRRQLATRTAVLLLVWLVLTAALVGIGDLVVHSAGVNAFDRHVTSATVARRGGTLDAVMRAVTWLGSWVGLVVGAVVVGLLVVCRRLPATFILVAVLGWAGTEGVGLIKTLVRRDRPPVRLRLVTAHGWSWPSGHTANATLVFTGLAVVVALLVARRWIRIAAGVVAGVAIAAVGCSRVVLGVHWTTDVIAGFVYVAVWLASVALIVGRELRAFPEWRSAERTPE